MSNITWDFVENLFDETFNKSSFVNSYNENSSLYDEEKGTLTLMVPGYSKDDLKVWVEKNKLYIKGNKKGFKPIDKCFYVNDNIDKTCTEAVVKNGVITISLKYKDRTDEMKFIKLK